MTLDRRRTPSNRIRAIVINSGNANACTGERGDRDAQRMAELAAETCGAQPDQVLVLSTGIIGEFLPMEKIAAGIRAAAAQLGSDEASLVAAARGMLTTDHTHKLAGRKLKLGEHTVQFTGMAKGAAMIGPRMATMLAVIMTDAALVPDDAQRLLRVAVEDSFNCISVDGHMSTNDTVLLVANGAAGGEPLHGAGLAEFAEVPCMKSPSIWPRRFPIDGEGATHLVTIDVDGLRHAAMPPGKSPRPWPRACWSRPPSPGPTRTGVGSSRRPDTPGVPFRPDGSQPARQRRAALPRRVSRRISIARPCPRSIRENRDTSMQLTFGEGTAQVRFWTTDLTAEYVRLNADYTT